MLLVLLKALLWKYRTSMARIPMARLPWMSRTRSLVCRDFLEHRKDIPQNYLHYASWYGTNSNPPWLELPQSRTNFHVLKGIRAIEVRLYVFQRIRFLKNVSEDTKEMPQSRRTAFLATIRRRNEEQTITKRTSDIKPPKNK